MTASAPTELRYRRDQRELDIVYGEQRFTLSAEFLRVHSPSAEVQGHDHQGGVLPLNKQDVAIMAIEPVGNYAVRIRFSDGHDSGLYSWDWLHRLCLEQQELWRVYQEKVATQDRAADATETKSSVGRFDPRK